jgi:hypothetical protein
VPERLGLLGVLGAADVDEAAVRWPRATFLPGLGLSATIDDPADYVPLLAYLDTVLTFVNVRPGAAGDDTGSVGLVAEVVIDPHPEPAPLVLRQLPDFGFVLLANTAAKPARVFATQSDAGVEVVVEGLPAEIQLPNGLLGPLRSEQEELLGPALVDVTQAGPFQPGDYDTFEVVLSEQRGSLLRVHVRVRLTAEGEVTIEPAVPISIGPCRFSGLPCDGVHDLGLLPYPTLSGAHTQHELALEWARHRIPGGLGIDGTGLVTVRTLDLNHGRDPLRGIVERMTEPDTGTTEARPLLPVEFVLEDLALPVSSWLTPVATHGRFGLRRTVLELGDEAEPYDMSLAPVTIDIGGPVDWQLKIFRLLFESPATVVARMAVVFGDDEGEVPGGVGNDDHAMVIDISDGWLLQGTWSPPHPRRVFRVANIGVNLMAVKVGVLLQGISEAQGAKGWSEHVRALVDIGIAVGEDESSFFKAKLNRPPGAALGQDVVLRDLGWDLGEFRFFPNLWFPDDLKFTAFEVVQLEIEELAMLNEDNGGRYLAFSGGVSIFPGAGDPKRVETEPATPGVPAEGQPSGGGIRFRRLRFRTGGNPEAPQWLLDGVTIFMRIDTFELSGFGTAVDHTRDGHRYREFGLGLFIAFHAIDKDFSIGAQLYYGKVSGPVDNFTYWLFGFQLGYCPLGPYELRGINLLVASGMTPALPEPSGRPQEMRLLDWYKANKTSGAVEVRSDRTQTRGGWRPEQGATAAGVGFDVGLSVSKNVLLRAFLFMHKSDTEFGFLVAVEVFILKGREPVGLGAIEVDTRNDKWSALIAVDLDFAKLLDTDSPLAKGLGTLTGSIFAGNKPGMFAIGQLADQSTWLTFAFNKSLLGLRARISFGVCLQISEKPGPRGFGFVACASAEGNLGVGKVQLYASFGLLIGTWGNEASSSGVIVTAEVALRIKVFYVFSFGASVKAIIEQLGPQEPNFKRASLEVRIETPWWLPDVTFRLVKISGTAAPEQMPVLSSPLTAAAAIEPGKLTAVDVAVTAIGEPGALHTIESLRVAPDAPIGEDAWAALVPVSLDSTIALDFAAALDNATTVAPSTPPDTGLQTAAAPAANDLSSRYTLLQLGVRRRPRFGEDAGVWTDLLAPENTEVGGLDDLLGDTDIDVTFASALRCRWDADVTKDNAIEPRRLLVNADTPFSFVTSSPATDEGILASDPAYPCCGGKRNPVSHMLDFNAFALGTRAPVTQRFSNSTSTLRWLLPRSPVVAPSAGPPAGTHVARVQPLGALGTLAQLTLAVVTLDEPAHLFDITVFWKIGETSSDLVAEAFRGLELVDRQVLAISGASPTVPIHLQSTKGITSVTLRCTNPSAAQFELRTMRYRTLAFERDFIAEQARCNATGHIAGGGKLAWLPNHDYEVIAKVRTTVDYQGTPQTAEVTQRAGFRTKGLPGLNAVATAGAELEPYVESVYPGPTGLLYRSEPIIVAFDERFSSLLPVDRDPLPGAVPEQTQLLEWVVAVARGDGTRLSAPSADWVLAHRGTAPPPPRWPRVIDDVLVKAGVRRVPSLSPFAARLDVLAASSPSCGPGQNLQSSQLLRHEPVGEPAAGSDDEQWASGTVLRAAVRRKCGPFVAREPFEDGDETALTEADEGSLVATSWQYTDGTVGVGGLPAAGVRHYAVFGDSDWDHVEVHMAVDPAGGAAGVALAVAGLPRVERALIVLIDEATDQLQILARRGGVTSPLATAPLPAGQAPYALQVTGFDDCIRARVGDTVAEAERGSLRNGRLALVSNGPGSFAALHVDAIEAYRFQVGTSRYVSFDDHLATWDRIVQQLPVDTTGAAALLTATSADIGAAMASGDSQLRQRVFDRWTSELTLPLQQRVDRVQLSGDARLLLLESPEPLPFSRDVRLVVTRTVTGFPGGMAELPRPWLALATSIEFTRDGVVRAEVPADIVGVVRRATRLVRAVVDRLTRRVRYQVYTVTLDGTLLHGVIEDTVNDLPRPRLGPPGRLLPPPIPRVPAGHLVLLDRFGNVVGFVLPLPVTTTETVNLTIVTNASETAALLIPTAGTLARTEHAFRFDLDRVRYRAATADDDSNYRASVTWQVTP